MEVLDTIDYKGYTIKVGFDMNPINPREDGNLGTMVCTHRRYNLGDINDYEATYSSNWREHIAEYFFDNYWDKMEDFMLEKFEDLDEEEYDNLVDDFAEDWKVKENLVDAIWEWIEKEIVLFDLSLYDHSGISMKIGSFSGWDSGQVGFIYAFKGSEDLNDDNIKNILELEVSMYDAYISGMVYEATLFDKEGYIVDSIGNCYQEEEAITEMKNSACWEIKRIIGYRVNRLKSLIKGKVNLQYREKELENFKFI